MYFIAGAEVGLREEQINAYKNLAVEQVQSLRRLKRDWPFLKVKSSGRVNESHTQPHVNYHQQFHAIRSKYDQQLNYEVQHNGDTEIQQNTASSVKAQHGTTQTNRNWSGLKVNSFGHVYDRHTHPCVNHDEQFPVL